MRILLVEDEPAIQELWADVLRERGYAVDLAGTLSDAKDRFAAQVYNLVITDWRLPDGDGRVVADWAAAHSSTFRARLSPGTTLGAAFATGSRKAPPVLGAGLCHPENEKVLRHP
jgi:CheY-like chemotaxis protein